MSSKDQSDDKEDGGKGKEGSSTYQKRNQERQQGTYKSLSNFKGATPGMHGNVFQVLGEKGTRNQFKDTLEALERYAGETYPIVIADLQPLFKRLEHPSVEPPPALTQSKDQEAKPTV